MTMKGFALALGSVLVAALPVHADLIYTFSFTSTSSPIEDFTFSITSSEFITAGSPTFDPFTITDGTNVWDIDQDLAGISTGIILGSTFLPAGDGCFAFGSAGAELLDNGCSFIAGPHGAPPLDAALVVAFNGGLPSETGTYSDLIFLGSAASQVGTPEHQQELFNNCCDGQNGVLNLTITETPEPRFLLLPLAACLLGVLLLIKKQKSPTSNRGGALHHEWESFGEGAPKPCVPRE